uniref:Uncharacterized protein n=1 Tax=Avena sativa TaxID=4498 RepID=A0ACD5TNU8_AVESA
MASSQDTRLKLLVLIALLVLVDTASHCHGRRIQGVDAMALGSGGAPPQPKGYSSEHTSSSTARQLPSRVYRRMHRVSKRLVPQGPNPLHN